MKNKLQALSRTLLTNTGKHRAQLCILALHFGSLREIADEISRDIVCWANAEGSYQRASTDVVNDFRQIRDLLLDEEDSLAHEQVFGHDDYYFSETTTTTRKDSLFATERERIVKKLKKTHKKMGRLLAELAE